MDKDLVERAKRGDRGAFDTLAKGAAPTLRGFLWRMIGHPEDTEDIAQAALVKAWNAIEGFRWRVLLFNLAPGYREQNCDRSLAQAEALASRIADCLCEFVRRV